MFSGKSEIWVRIVILFLVCGFVLLLFPASTTLLYPQVFYDSLVFNIMGEGWGVGAVPYQRLFDHKGPLLYLIQLVGDWIAPGKIGAFIIELVCAVLTFELIFRCGRVLGATRRLNYLSLLVAMVLYAAYIDGGNCVEQWSLPFEVLPLLLVLKYFKGHIKSPVRIAFVAGLCFGAVAMLRINNNCIICGIVIGLAVLLCMQRQYKVLFYSAGMFMAGIIASCAPFIIYFYSVGAIEPMIYANYVFNVHYKANWAEPLTLLRFTQNAVRLTPCILLPLLAWFYDKNCKGHVFIVLFAISIITFFVFIGGSGYGHYYLMGIPMAALCMQVANKQSRVVKFSIAFVILFPIIFFYYKVPKGRVRKIMELRREAKAPTTADFIMEHIPESERGSIYTYGSPEVAGAVISAGYLPAGKYFFMQMNFPKVDGFIREDIIRDFKEANPMWVISSPVAPSKAVVPLDSTNYREIPVDSLPVTFPRNWHLYRRI